MNSTGQYKCPNCKHSISITRADFIKGIAVASCGDCGKDAFAMGICGSGNRPYSNHS